MCKLIRKALMALNDKNNLNLLVTDQLNKKLPIYGWYNYKHSFARELVFSLLTSMGIERFSKVTVLDPFCGAGTTLLAAKEYGINSIGIDVMPFATFISEAKALNYDYLTLEKGKTRLFNFLSRAQFKYSIYKGKRELLKKYFSPSVLEWILLVLFWIRRQSNKQVHFFYLTALFSILEELSQMKKDGGFLRNFPREIDTAKASDMYLQKIESMLSDIKINSIQGAVPTLFTEDIRCLGREENSLPIVDNSIDAVITSPPYPNRHDYTRIYSLESILGFSDNVHDIKHIRYKTLRSHVEAKASYKNELYQPPQSVANILNMIQKETLPNREVVPMLNGYFEDMFYVFKELYKKLKPNAYFALVVCDVRYAGVIVPVGEILNQISIQVGFSLEQKVTARYKNNSAQQMVRYGKSPIGEYVFLWKK